MPTRDRGKGTYIIDRRLPGVGRLKLASGTTDAKTFKRLNGMLDTLVARGRLDIIEAMARHIVTPLEVWDRFRVEDLDRLPTAETLRRLWPEKRPDGTESVGAMETYRLAVKGAHHQRAMKSSFKRLRELSKPTASIADLPALVAKARAYYEGEEQGTSFNRLRSHVQAFLRDTVGSSHRLWLDVASVRPLPVKKRKGKPFTARDLFDHLAQLADQAGDEYAQMARAMALTGMHQDEYWGRWTAKGDRLEIHGTKREGRDRVIPLVESIAKPTRHRRTFEDKVREVVGGRRVVYDYRRTFAHLMEEARIPRARRMAYIGHAAGDVTDLYERHEVEAYLAQDRETLRAYLAKIIEQAEPEAGV